MTTDPPSTKPAASPRKAPAQVVPFPGRKAPAPPSPKPAARRPLCSVPGFLRAVREARELRPDLSRETIIAVARAPALANVERLTGPSVLATAEALAAYRVRRAAGGRT